MAIDNKIPKGPSNSAKMGATPGTQQTAANNLATGGFNPNMPMASQVANQARSSYQQGLARAQGMPTMPSPRPTPSPATPVRQTGRPVAGRGMPLDQGRGYNIFSGMDAGQISGMNQSMGLSNMTSLPSLAKGVQPGQIFKPGQGAQFSGQVMLGDAPSDSDYSKPDTLTINGQEFVYNPETGRYEYGNLTYNPDTGEVVSSVFGVTTSLGTVDTLDEYVAANAANATPEETEESPELVGGVEFTGEGVIKNSLAEILAEKPGMDEEKMEEVQDMLDNKYAAQLQAMLIGVDRQAAMMGTFGSGAHSMSINNVTAQALAQMADEYAELGKVDLTQYETDLQESILNQLAISDRLIANADFSDDGAVEDLLNMEKFLTGTDESPISNYISAELAKIAPGGHHAFYGMLNELGNSIFSDLASGEMSETEAITKYKELSSMLFSALTAYASGAGGAFVSVPHPFIPGKTVSAAINQGDTDAVQALFDEFFAAAGMTSSFTVSY